uniref:DUF4371 domain-containing protein n=1 Tax=Nicotiana tabacum TaxID=4097 RepID=A0A1S4DEB5_TOBAC|nr:PREDICTED: uncharacterized protein LOC107828823 [Nicotiana tabacum]
MTSQKIQKDIVSACAQETVKAIIDDLGGDYFGVLVDESKDISHHEQMALSLQYVNKKGQVNESFIGIVRVVVVNKHKEVETFFAIIANVLNVVGASFKCRDQLRDHQAELLDKLLESGELQSGKGLNQERGLQRPGDTRWGSHYRTLDNFIVLFSSIVHVLEVVEYEGSEADDRLQTEAFLSKINEFDFIFLLHLMLKVLMMSNELSKALQKKE